VPVEALLDVSHVFDGSDGPDSDLPLAVLVRDGSSGVRHLLG